jgi:hypothetical protein
MEIEEITIEPVKFMDFIQGFRKEELDGAKISKEVLVRDWGPDYPIDKHLIYVADGTVAVCYIPIIPTEDKILSYYLIRDVPSDKNGETDYRSAYQALMEKNGYGRVGRGIVVRKGEKNPMVVLSSGLVFHEGIFKDLP